LPRLDQHGHALTQGRAASYRSDLLPNGDRLKRPQPKRRLQRRIIDEIYCPAETSIYPMSQQNQVHGMKSKRQDKTGANLRYRSNLTNIKSLKQRSFHSSFTPHEVLALASVGAISVHQFHRRYFSTSLPGRKTGRRPPGEHFRP
jgi:hypothetical protein